MSDKELDAMIAEIRRNNKSAMMGVERPDVIIGPSVPLVAWATPRLCQRCAATIYLTDGLTIAQRWPKVPVLCMECAVKDCDE